MLRHTIIRLAILSFIVAVIALAGVGYLIWDTMQKVAIRSDEMANSRSTVSQQASDAHLHAIAVSTAADRTQLQELFQTDIVSIVNIIESAGSSGNSNTQITDASQPVAAGKGNTSAVHAIVFTTQTEGTFAGVMHTASVFEHLPLPSTVEQLDLVRTGGEGNAAKWHMNARIRVLTTSNISS